MVQCHAARVVIACLTRVEDLARGFMPRSSITCVQFTRVSTFLFFRQLGRAVHAGFVYSFTSHVLMGIFQCINGFRLYDGPAPYTIDLTFVTCLQDGNFMQSSAEVTIKMSRHFWTCLHTMSEYASVRTVERFRRGLFTIDISLKRWTILTDSLPLRY